LSSCQFCTVDHAHGHTESTIRRRGGWSGRALQRRTAGAVVLLAGTRGCPRRLDRAPASTAASPPTTAAP